ncbi:hypothetical protein PROFUN_08120 [Planoprotostelium fungivorum]|uniref:Uncharacterized protein n=1 Tax=Planoprotostelium fungivorum TaxID=1890364 RepID=A0A2P6MQF1_9EUKA|nr:hypothetical protein PROFUN_08120 [Planoprotostelium fungivorum]
MVSIAGNVSIHEWIPSDEKHSHSSSTTSYTKCQTLHSWHIVEACMTRCKLWNKRRSLINKREHNKGREINQVPFVHSEPLLANPS